MSTTRQAEIDLSIPDQLRQMRDWCKSQGLAVAAFYAHRLAGPPFLRAAVVVLVLVNPWAPQILALLGLFDIFFNFRKWALPPEAREG